MKRNKMGFLITFACLSVLYIVFTSIYANKRNRKDFEVFNKSYIYGEVVYIKSKHRGVAFRVGGDEKEYIFHPEIKNNGNNKKSFLLYVELGDTISKEAYSRELKLLKDGKVIVFEFQNYYIEYY